MSEAQENQETETTGKRAKAEVETVKMLDGREVGFAGKRNMLKEVLENGVRFDFRNGDTRTFTVPDGLQMRLAIHGAAQKIGDEVAGVKDVEDMVAGVDEIMKRLEAGEWGIARQGAGDSFSGASVVIRAICEHTGKSAQEVKDFLQKKLDAADGKLSRQALYNSFRQSATIGPIIERLEKDKVKKASGVNADELLGELG